MSHDFFDQQVARMFFKQPSMAEALERDSQMNIDNQILNDSCYGNKMTDHMINPNDKIVDMRAKVNAINPPHCQAVVGGLQYMECMVDMLEGKNGVEAHLFGQVYKYLMRCGKKDKPLQELEKAQWYLNALVNYTRDGDLGI